MIEVHAFVDILDATVASITVGGENVEVTRRRLPWHRDSLIYQRRTRGQSTTGTNLNHNEFAERKCMALPIFVPKDEGLIFSLVSLPSLAVFLRDLTSDQRAEAQTPNSFGTSGFAASLVTDGITICLMTWYSETWTETSHLHSSRASTTSLRACDATPCRGSLP